MMTVHEVSTLTGVSVRTLQYYDRIGLLPPAGHTQAGYRLYDGAALERLQQILLFRELEFPLKEIRAILASPAFDRGEALERQITLLTLKKERLERLISLAHHIREKGGCTMDFSAFDKTQLEQYTREARERWGGGEVFREYDEKRKGRSSADEAALAQGMMDIFAEFGQHKTEAPDSPAAAALMRRLQEYITGHYYRCTPEILASLGEMYTADPRFTANIDKAGGAGTAQFASRAIRLYCGQEDQ